jgi:fructan beta-fructosidase
MFQHNESPSSLRAALLAVVALTLSACAQPAATPQAHAAAQAERATAATAPYAEPHRPQFHFSPPSMWMNDPNGMVYYDGEYHLFYQYYPNDTVWGPMHWGHAVSSDLVHWENLPIALYPDDLGYIFSGSAVVDWRNTSGFGRDGAPPLVAIFTYHNPQLAEAGGRDHEYQGIAWSNDRGRSWTKYAGNPVLPNTQRLQDFRDPKVFWHAASERWIMALSANDHVQFWASPDLKRWHHLSDFGREWGAHGGVWECPDLVPMRVDGAGEERWVLILNLNPGGPQGGSGTQYFVGDFDGARFTLDERFKRTLIDEGAVWLDHGRDNYAGVTWADVPPEDGRHLFIGWMGNWDYAQQVPTRGWRSAMTLPRTLTLHDTPAGLRVFSNPVRELQTLRTASFSLPETVIEPGRAWSPKPGLDPSQSELILEFELPASGAASLAVELSNALGERYVFGYDTARNEFASDRRHSGDTGFAESFAGVHRATRLAEGRTLRLHLFFDVASVEVFADGGATVMTDIFFPTQPFSQLRIRADGQALSLNGGEIHQLGSIWR